MQHVRGRAVALEDDQLVVRRFHGGRLTFTLNQFAVNGGGQRLRGFRRFRERHGSKYCEQNEIEQPHIPILAPDGSEAGPRTCYNLCFSHMAIRVSLFVTCIVGPALPESGGVGGRRAGAPRLPG